MSTHLIINCIAALSMNNMTDISYLFIYMVDFLVLVSYSISVILLVNIGSKLYLFLVSMIFESVFSFSL